MDHSAKFIIKKVVNNSADAYEVENQGDAPRQFDKDWLKSKFGYYKLKGIINRIDRKDFDEVGRQTCGELRFIYRLAYNIQQESGNRYYSSLPFFFNVVYEFKHDGEDCRTVSQSWITPENYENNNAKYANWIMQKLNFQQTKFKQLETNFQSLRFTGNYKQDFGGQAMYMMRIFKLAGDGQFEPIYLENTPDLQKLMNPKNSSVKKELMSFIKNNMKEIDLGTYQLPHKFLAKLAISYSTVGRARLANKPFDRLFNAEEFHDLNYEGNKFVNSGAGVIERLNNNTCMGCHQSGGMAGFHAFGLPTKEVNDPFSSLELPFSAHLYAETKRREYYVKSLSKGIEPNKLRPHSFYPEGQWSQEEVIFQPRKDKEVCLSSTADFKVPLTCDGSFNGKTVCSSVATNQDLAMEFKECINYRGGEGARVSSGVACVRGNVKSNHNSIGDHEYTSDKSYAELKKILTYNFYDFTDQFTAPTQASGKSLTIYEKISRNHKERKYSCRPPVIGVPLGRRFRRCSSRERSMHVYDEFNAKGMKQVISHHDLVQDNIYPQEICATVGGSNFEKCAMGNDVVECLKKKVVRGVLDTCYPGRFCREDYICQRLPIEVLKKSRGQSEQEFLNSKSVLAIKALHDRNIGYCNPSYFIFNMRSDGHPFPTGDGKVKSTDEVVVSEESRGGYKDKY